MSEVYVVTSGGWDYGNCPYCGHLVPFLGYHWFGDEALCKGPLKSIPEWEAGVAFRWLFHQHRWEAIYGGGSPEFCMDSECGEERA